MCGFVNKANSLRPKTYQPFDLVSVGGSVFSKKMTTSLQAMMAKAKSEGVTLRVISGYRSYDYQSNLYSAYVKKDGQAAADTYSARPGHSEHQTGLTADLKCRMAAAWMFVLANARRCLLSLTMQSSYGFIIRYLQSNQSITGYQAEPWHLRFVGVSLAKEMEKQVLHTRGVLGVDGGKSYIN